jgi:hypothetical protein
MLTSGCDEDGTPTGGAKIIYEYYPDKLNTIGNENMGISYF